MTTQERCTRVLRRQCHPSSRRSRRCSQAPRYVHRVHRRARSAPPCLRSRRQLGGRSTRRAL
ncbi:MAG: hypothetical protein EBS51_15655, partial [Planctomycetia bacterium]|nr:hypothetical protein [Planctomycetia bacterium]